MRQPSIVEARIRRWQRLLPPLLLAFATAVPEPAAAAARRPDIVFVLADDMEAAALRHMPEMRRIATEGTTFAAAYATSPVCTPSRATILTGNYPQNTGIRRNRPPFGGFETFRANGLERDTAAVWLRRAGYRTALIGKYLNNHTAEGPALHVPPGWDRWVTAAEWRFTHRYRGFALNEDGRRVEYPVAESAFLLDVYADKASAFVRDALTRPQPFALFLWLPVPHQPLAAAPRHGRLYPGARVPRLASLPEADVGDKPPFLRFAPPTTAALADLDGQHRQRLRMLRSLDDAVGRIRQLLAGSGRLDNAFLVLTSDNGWHHAYHNLPPWKGTAYEEDVRVPLIVRGPGVAAGRTVRRLVANADLAPTFAAWAGARHPEVDGRSLAPLLKAHDPAAVPWRKRLPLYRLPEAAAGPATAWPRHGAPRGAGRGYACMAGVPAWRPGPPSQDTIAMPEFRGLRGEHATFVQYASGDLEFYDNARDPRQLENAVCRLPAASVEALSAASAGLARCRGAACRRIENR